MNLKHLSLRFLAALIGGSLVAGCSSNPKATTGWDKARTPSSGSKSDEQWISRPFAEFLADRVAYEKTRNSDVLAQEEAWEQAEQSHFLFSRGIAKFNESHPETSPAFKDAAAAEQVRMRQAADQLARGILPGLEYPRLLDRNRIEEAVAISKSLCPAGALKVTDMGVEFVDKKGKTGVIPIDWKQVDKSKTFSNTPGGWERLEYGQPLISQLLSTTNRNRPFRIIAGSDSYKDGAFYWTGEMKMTYDRFSGTPRTVLLEATKNTKVSGFRATLTDKEYDTETIKAECLSPSARIDHTHR